MKLTVTDAWSPDVNPPSEGEPPDPLSFAVFVQVRVADDGGDDEVFHFMAATRDRVRQGFVGQTLVLERFSWSDIKAHVQRRLDVVGGSAASWSDVVRTLWPVMKHSDSDARPAPTSR